MKELMRIVIDLQGAQTDGSTYRGIGRYSLSLALAMARQVGRHELFVALNHAFPETIESIRERFRDLIPPEHVLVWRSPGPVAMAHDANPRRTLVRELVREHTLYSLKPDIVHVSSIFEGFGDDAVTSIGRFRAQTPTAVTLYDLIPYHHPDLYLADPVFKRWYLDKLSNLRAADLHLAVSNYSRAEAVEALGLAEDRITVVMPDADPQFRQVTFGLDAERGLLQRHALNPGFLMCTGGIDYRKNIEGLIEAFARLPHEIRIGRQLVIVGKASEDDRTRFARLSQRLDLRRDDVLLTGFVSDDDLVGLYNLCELFVFPSLHEGFALPILEAMRCGAPVIGSDRSAIPEVIGWRDALFDPTSVVSIVDKLVEALTSDAFRRKLREHSVVNARRFSWDESARRALGAFEALHEDRRCTARSQAANTPGRPRLAYLSPLPPERSGIADYSAELLPELARYYRIELITDLEGPGSPYLDANFPRRTIAYFEGRAEEYDRILYHFGNSRFHRHMFRLIDRFPGTVVLHDSYLGSVLWSEEMTTGAKVLSRALYRSHGYGALLALKAEGVEAAVRAFPCNLDVLNSAQGVIVHSQYARALAEPYCVGAATSEWAYIPQLRRSPREANRSRARRVLGLPEDAFIAASFGIMHPLKLNHRLLSAWLQSALAKRADCYLLFVGPIDSSYERVLRREIEINKCRGPITLAGDVSPGDYERYLQAADAAVQLKDRSHGETSRTILDCLANGLGTVVNAIGTAVELPDDVVVKLPEEFGDYDLARALMRLAVDRPWRRALGERARNYVSKNHDPAVVARRFADAIEQFASTHPRATLHRLICSLASGDGENGHSHAEVVDLALAIAENEPRTGPKRLLVDVSSIARNGAPKEIERVTRNILRVLLEDPPAGYRVEPVFCPENRGNYRYARACTQRFLDLGESGLEDAPIDIYPGDVFLGLDWNVAVSAEAVEYLRTHARRGLRVYFIVYNDLLPIRYPQWFPPEVASSSHNWLARLAGLADGFVCVSRTVADELTNHLTASRMARRLKVGYFHLGAGIGEGKLNTKLSKKQRALLARIDGRNALLMVGTVEPRMAHSQVLDAMEILWAAGEDVSLVIAGNEGWMVERLVRRLRTHRERGNRLFWFERVSDELLERLYRQTSALVMASEGEGFGLPMVEAAQYGLPIIARDLPVFREIAGDHAVYFAGANARGLAAVLTAWLPTHPRADVPDVAKMPCLTWAQSASQLLDVFLERKWYRTINAAAAAENDDDRKTEHVIQMA